MPRPKGSPNRKTQALMDKCEAMGVDPFEGMLILARDSEDDSIRLGAYKELCQYLYPKRKAVEVTDERDRRIIERARQIEQLPKEEKAKLMEKGLKLIKSKA